MKRFYKKIELALILLSMFLLIFPTQLASANSNNKTVSDMYSDNPELHTEDPTAVGETAVGLTAWDYIKMLLTLLFVLVLLIWVLKFISKKSAHFQQNNIVRNLGGISLGSQKSVQILQIGDTLYVVGVGENVELLKEINDSDEIEKLLSYYNEKQTITAGTPYITELVQKLKGHSKKSGDESDHNFGNLLNQRLSEIKKVRRDELEKWKEKEHDK